jgi:hypothetical protein
MNIKAKFPSLSITDLCDVKLIKDSGVEACRFHVVTPEEADEKELAEKKDTTWHICHEFYRGYYWRRPSDGSVVYRYYLENIGIDFKGFPVLPSFQIEEIVNKIKKDNEKERKLIEENPTKVEFKEFVFPKFIKKETEELLNDVIDVGSYVKQVINSEPLYRKADELE